MNGRGIHFQCDTGTTRLLENKTGVVIPRGFTAGGKIASSPAIAADGTIYFGSDDGNLHALDANGNEVWSFATGDYVFASPAIGPDGNIYFASAMFGKPIRYVAVSVLPALLAIFLGTLAISWLPVMA